MRNEGGGFAANIYEAMPESRIQMTSYQSLCAPIPQLPVTSHSFLLSNFKVSPLNRFALHAIMSTSSIYISIDIVIYKEDHYDH